MAAQQGARSTTRRSRSIARSDDLMAIEQTRLELRAELRGHRGPGQDRAEPPSPTCSRTSPRRGEDSVLLRKLND